MKKVNIQKYKYWKSSTQIKYWPICTTYHHHLLTVLAVLYPCHMAASRTLTGVIGTNTIVVHHPSWTTKNYVTCSVNELQDYLKRVEEQTHPCYRNIPTERFVCVCNKSLVLTTSRSEKTPARLYLMCQCKFFQWIDEPPQKNFFIEHFFHRSTLSSSSYTPRHDSKAL